MAATCAKCHSPIPPGSVYCRKCGAAAPTQPAQPHTQTFAPSVASDPAHSIMARLGRTLGPSYDVRRLVGRGGFAEVYELWDRNLERRLAAKVLDPEVAWTPGTLERFKQEARTVARLNHPAILPIHFVGDFEGLAYYVMPFVEGSALDAVLVQRGRLTPDESVRIAKPVLEALAHAHDAGLIHRDIKPDNVMLEDNTGRVLLVDFGIAKILDPEKASHMTQAGFTIGTPHYMSPEQALGQQLDARSDLYSFGALLFEMVTGQKPFEGDSSQEIVGKHIAEAVCPPVEVEPSIPAWLSDAIVRCLEKKPKDRFQSAQEVLEAFEKRIVTAPSPAPDELGVGDLIREGDASWETLMPPTGERPQESPPTPTPPKTVAPAAPEVERPAAMATPGESTAPSSKSAAPPPPGEALPTPTPLGAMSAAEAEPQPPPPGPPAPAPEELEVRGTLAPEPAEVRKAKRGLKLRRPVGVVLFAGLVVVAGWWLWAGGVGQIVALWSGLAARLSGNTLYVTNSLVEPVELMVNGEVHDTLGPGQRDSLVLPGKAQIAWRLVQPRRAGREQGMAFSPVVAAAARSGRDRRVVITAIAANRAVFAPLVTNPTNRAVVALINAGTAVEVRCNCIIPARSNRAHIGYYPLMENTAIRFFDARQGYRGRYVEVRVGSNRVDGLSGAVEVTVPAP